MPRWRAPVLRGRRGERPRARASPADVRGAGGSVRRRGAAGCFPRGGLAPQAARSAPPADKSAQERVHLRRERRLRH